MELKGISLNVKFYAELEKEFEGLTTQIVTDVEALAGHPVNLKSPKQIATLLFEEQSLPVIKKTKTGYSTDADVLEELAAMGTNPIPEMLLHFRELEKLNSTYVKVLPRLVAQDGRLHTHFRPGNAATGRLSSDNPNLQNIPVRSENGRRLRKGFVASPGKILLSADYSQVELRILAHYTEDPVMLDAFNNDKDIHVQTAAEVFGIQLDKVTKEHRNSAKAINFGLMYGQGAFGLSQTLKISQTDARDYIKLYFQRFGRVKGYLDSLKEKAEATGYAETLFGRKRFIPEIHSQNRQVKSMAERIAINSPIQGTAADIIKLAMINLQKDLLEKKFKATLLLQVHDELILELPPEEKEEIEKLVRMRMETAVKLRTHLKVDIGTGLNWYELK
jgi:DNA polymerase-1